MRKTKFTLVLMMALMAGIWQGCQQEVTEIINPPVDEVFKDISPVSDLLQRTSLNDGSIDNIIDGASCLSLEFPVTVIVNGIEIQLEDIEDLSEVEDILDEYDDDDDHLIIQFPIIVKLADHSEIELSSEDELEDLVEDCNEGGDDDDIECVDFKYPLEINTYNTDNQVSGVITIDDDSELYQFLDKMDDGDLAGFKFPVTLILIDGSEVLANNNQELEDILENAIDDCDEDDDNDHNDDDGDDDDDDEVDDQQLIAVITDGSWKITSFRDDDGDDMSAAFEGYAFTFLASGVATAKKGVVVIDGSWSISEDDDQLELELNFGDDSPMDELAEDWDVTEYSELQIKLAEDLESDTEVLVFQKIQ